jgi:hypothetical protein
MEMKVNRENYEIWMIDYFDGKLNAGEVEELMAFIATHDDIREEFELFSNESIDAAIVSFDQKEDLKKTIKPLQGINELNYEEYFIAFFENDLIQEEKDHVLGFVALNPSLENEFKLHQKLIIPVENELIFANKDSLKKQRRITPFVYWATGVAAAVIVLLFSIFSLTRENVAIPVKETERPNLTSIKGSDPEIDLVSDVQPTLYRTDFEPVAERSSFDEIVESEKRSDIRAMETLAFDISLINEAELVYVLYLPYFESDVLYADNSLVTESQKKKPFLGRIIKNMAGKVSGSENKKESDSDNREPAILRILDQSVTVFNTVTGSDNEIVKTYNEDGNLTNYRFEGQALSWSRNVSENTE